MSGECEKCGEHCMDCRCLSLEKTYCQHHGFTRGMSYVAEIDHRRKYYICNLCTRKHRVKDGLKMPEKNA